MTVRLLNSSDKAKLMQFTARAPRPDGSFDDHLLNASNRLEHPQVKVYGLFLDLELIASVAVNLWSQLPYFAFFKLLIKENNFTIKEHLKLFEMLGSHIIVDMLQMQRTGFFYAMKKSHFYKGNFDTNAHSWTEKHVPIFRLFQFNFEYYHDGLTTSSFETFNSFFGNSETREMLLRRASLKPAVFKELYIDKVDLNEIIAKYCYR